MLRVGEYIFKRAETEEEFEQIHRLNYRTFVNEIPQHTDPGNGRLVDKFHAKNAYFIALHGDRVVGMVSVHDQPPFSVAERLSDPAILHRPGTRPLEVRLLAVEPNRRNGTVFAGLAWLTYEHARAHGYTHLYISGVEERLPLYRQLGFEPLGPAVRSGNASFVPMVATVGQLTDRHRRTIHRWHNRLRRVAGHRPEPVCLLPGPVALAPAVREAFAQPPLYHRGPEFIALFERIRRALAALTNSQAVALFNGSGTLGNEVIGAALAAGPRAGRGLLLVNGEFGQRLVRQAARFGLQPRVLSWPWGRPWDLAEVEAALAEEPEGSWVWGVHLESSTGVLNDLPGLVRLARARGIRVCADCVSSLGAVPLDLSEVYLASGATGKSLGSYAGAAVVFAAAQLPAEVDSSRVPSYLDLTATLASIGPRYTFPSPTLQALAVALENYATPELARARYDHYAALGAYVREQLRRAGLEPLAADAWASPVVTTFAPPAGCSSQEFVRRCRCWGFAIGGESSYLAERRLVQIATMGAVTREDCEPLFRHLRGEAGPDSDEESPLGAPVAALAGCSSPHAP
ncbi:MAG TPA: aminotransferase class V-fold PLP-dependent enzyme [Gemmataceae bacterium]|nr:aminotransferase class V-fold PLP-dependent enzyme [Gemmataceae bacterium]